MKLGLNRIATQAITNIQGTLLRSTLVGRMTTVPLGNLSAQADIKTRGATVSFLVNSLEGVDSFVLLRNFSPDIGSAQIISIWQRSTLLSTPQSFPIAVNYSDSDQSIAGQKAYYWVKAIPASNKTQDNVFISGPQLFDASGSPAAPTITADTAVSQSYTPTTQPLSGISGAGANEATIQVAAFQVQYPFGVRSYNSGSITPLADSTTYYVYCNDPTYKGGAQAYIATLQNEQLTAQTSTIYLGIITTPAHGGGNTGGGGGGGGPCFDPETKVLTIDATKAFEELKVGDQVLTLAGWRRVRKVLVHEYDGPLHEMPDGGLVTPDHRIRRGDGWVRAAEIFGSIVHYVGPVYNLSIFGASDAEHCYRLANGYTAHNQVKTK